MTAIAIFVKTPGLSLLKTRLAASTGQARAEKIYSACAAAVAEVSVSAAVGEVYWAVAEAADTVAEYWVDLPLLAQGEGGLGERMHRVMAEMVQRHGSGLLLGADAPQIEANAITRAADWLAEKVPRCVVGPARDGGFWTFGANHVVAKACWTRVSYSQSDTLRSFRAAVAPAGDWLELPALTDLDTIEDLDGVISELNRLERPEARQKALIRQLECLRTETDI